MEVQKGNMASPYQCRVDSQRQKRMNRMSATNYVRVVEYHQRQRRCATVYAIVYQTGRDMSLTLYRLYSHLVFLRFPYGSHRCVVRVSWLLGRFGK